MLDKLLSLIYTLIRKKHKVEWKICMQYFYNGVNLYPTKAHPSDAGYDLFCANETITIPPHELRMINLGFSCALPEGYELQIRPKSGLACRNYLTVLNTPGTVDCHYRGVVQAIVMNHGDMPYTFKRGDRVCQGVICELPNVADTKVSSLDDTDRGDGGFGSTGK